MTHNIYTFRNKITFPIIAVIVIRSCVYFFVFSLSGLNYSHQIQTLNLWCWTLPPHTYCIDINSKKFIALPRKNGVTKMFAKKKLTLRWMNGTWYVCIIVCVCAARCQNTRKKIRVKSNMLDVQLSHSVVHTHIYILSLSFFSTFTRSFDSIYK